jgi:uncharacterized membrane protein
LSTNLKLHVSRTTIYFGEKKKVSKSKEGWSRSLIKSMSWRIVGTLDTILISYFITGEMSFALSIGGIELVTKMMLYVAHERLWNKVNWGKK